MASRPDWIASFEFRSHSVSSLASFHISGSSIVRSPKKHGPHNDVLETPFSFSIPTTGWAVQRVHSMPQMAVYMRLPRKAKCQGLRSILSESLSAAVFTGWALALRVLEAWETF